ncbi:MAG: hypothetical protein SOT14_01550 [Succinivibrio sp.]|nr:hypothetical protein [Succinivibrio sp.]
MALWALPREGGDEFALFLNSGSMGEWIQKLEGFCRRPHFIQNGRQELQF